MVTYFTMGNCPLTRTVRLCPDLQIRHYQSLAINDDVYIDFETKKRAAEVLENRKVK